MSNRGWIGVDLDGTLAHYEGWLGIDHIGDPIPKMAERVHAWVAEGWEVRIFTARVSNKREEVEVTRTIKRWLKKHGLPELEVTNVKDYAMVALWDDRAVQVIENTGLSVHEYHGIEQ